MNAFFSLSLAPIIFEIFTNQLLIECLQRAPLAEFWFSNFFMRYITPLKLIRSKISGGADFFLGGGPRTVTKNLKKFKNPKTKVIGSLSRTDELPPPKKKKQFLFRFIFFKHFSSWSFVHFGKSFWVGQNFFWVGPPLAPLLSKISKFH